MESALSPDLARKMDAYWRAANYLRSGRSICSTIRCLHEPLKLEHIKPRLLGHWGTTPGLNFIYVHLNRVIKRARPDMIYITGPGHGGPALVANAYLEGTYSEVYPEHQPRRGRACKRLFKQFSFPGGIPSHVAPETPGSIHEGGELGYSLSHAYGAAFDNPDLIVACVVGDGEAETGPLATSWHSQQVPQSRPRWRRAADPAPQRLQDRQPDRPGPHQRRGAGAVCFVGYGYKPYFVEGARPAEMHQLMAATLDTCVAEIKRIQADAARERRSQAPACWPMIVLRTPKGWTGPEGGRWQDRSKATVPRAPGADGRHGQAGPSSRCSKTG